MSKEPQELYDGTLFGRKTLGNRRERGISWFSTKLPATSFVKITSKKLFLQKSNSQSKIKNQKSPNQKILPCPCRFFIQHVQHRLPDGCKCLFINDTHIVFMRMPIMSKTCLTRYRAIDNVNHRNFSDLIDV